MPVYEYQCRACNSTFPAYVKHFDLRKGERHCPKCSGMGTYQGISQVTVGKEYVFGLVMKDGTRLRGSMPKP